ncbi:Essential recombination function protein [uncultured Caudovirales phage]|uniref:Essential recombination function protein n=1 Tax=uncultured Caudovirales phage TaxID=2100421 RepID=A0A6J7WY89_9CAUD|nr:Essential recombination function protein [uncultured Caudovirales phage]
MNAPKKVEADSLANAMAAAFAEIESATKATAGQVGQQKYKYADLTSVIEAIKPALVKNNLFFTQNPRPHTSGVEVETILHHAGGEHMSMGSLFVPADRANAQGFGSALTYARRYALVTAFGVPVEDDDGKAATAAPPAPAAAKKPVAHSALQTEVRQFVHELQGCGDADELNAFLKTPDALRIVREVKEKLPHWWDGEDWPEGKDRPGEFIPLADRIDIRTRECAEATARYITA